MDLRIVFLLIAPIIIFIILIIKLISISKNIQLISKDYINYLKIKGSLIPFRYGNPYNNALRFEYNWFDKLINYFLETHDFIHINYAIYMMHMSDQGKGVIISICIIVLLINDYFRKRENYIINVNDDMFIISVIMFIIIVLYLYIFYYGKIKVYKKSKIIFINYLNKNKDFETLNYINRFGISKSNYLLHKYNKTGDINYLAFALRHIYIYRNGRYIMVLFIILVIINHFPNIIY